MSEPESSSVRTTILRVLDGSGDTKFIWDHSDAEQREEARRTVADLKAKGYTFFAVGGEPMDEIAMGAGELIVRRLDASEIVPEEPTPEPEAEPASIPAPKRRGRPRKAESVVAVRPLAGG